MSPRRRRNLSREERALWEHTVKHAAPLHKRSAEAAEAAPAETKATPLPPSPVQAPPLPAAAPAATRPPRLGAIDPRTRTRLARGSVAIDARLDLHFLTQDRAHRRLVRFLGEAHAIGHRVVLVITGKGKAASDGGEEERGVLRRQVPLWLNAPELRPLVSGFGEAHVVHGGAGALYVRLRRHRPGS